MATRREEFEKKLDALLDEFSDMDFEEIADSLDYYASIYSRKANQV